MLLCWRVDAIASKSVINIMKQRWCTSAWWRNTSFYLHSKHGKRGLFVIHTDSNIDLVKAPTSLIVVCELFYSTCISKWVANTNDSVRCQKKKKKPFQLFILPSVGLENRKKKLDAERESACTHTCIRCPCVDVLRYFLFIRSSDSRYGVHKVRRNGLDANGKASDIDTHAEGNKFWANVKRATYLFNALEWMANWTTFIRL